MFLLKQLIREEGQGITEYALILGLVVLGVWVSVSISGYGTAVTGVFTAVKGSLTSCSGGNCGN